MIFKIIVVAAAVHLFFLCIGIGDRNGKRQDPGTDFWWYE